MSGGSVEDRLARIGAALARIEHAVDRVQDHRDAAVRRHARLREAVTESLEQLDILIAGSTQ